MAISGSPHYIIIVFFSKFLYIQFPEKRPTMSFRLLVATLLLIGGPAVLIGAALL